MMTIIFANMTLVIKGIGVTIRGAQARSAPLAP
jgi:hypothetical protein